MSCEEIRTKQALSYISVCSLSILYNSKFILMATSLGTNAVVVTRVHCIQLCSLRGRVRPQHRLNRYSIFKETGLLIGFNDTSTLVGHFVSSPREREKRDRDSKGDEREGHRRKRKMNESEETEEIKTFLLYPNLLQG